MLKVLEGDGSGRILETQNHMVAFWGGYLVGISARPLVNRRDYHIIGFQWKEGDPIEKIRRLVRVMGVVERISGTYQYRWIPHIARKVGGDMARMVDLQADL